METRASYLLVGSFVLVLTAALIAVVVWLGGKGLDQKNVRYASYFAGDVTGLGIGNAVRYRGVPVGSVVNIAIDPKNVERVRVIMEVDETTPIKTDTVAQLALQGITGVAFIQLTGGTQNAAALARPADKRELPVIATRESAVQKILTRLPEIFEKVLSVADRIVLLFDEKNLGAVTKILENLEQFSENARSTTDDARALIGEAKSAAGALKDTAAAIRSLTENIGKQVDPVAGDVRRTASEMRLAVAEFSKTLKNVTAISSEIEQLVKTNKRSITDFSQTELYEFTGFLTEARTLVDALTRLTNRIERDPAQFFFGDSQKGVRAQ